MYHVIFEDHNESCTCGDYARNITKEPNFKCKHLLSVMNCLATGDVHSGQFLERSRPKLDERWIIAIEGSQFVKYAGLLDLGHQKGISQIEVEPLQLPTKDNGNFAICKATVVSKLGETFTDIGDANPNNCSSKVARHLLRLASTRAIGRALRTFTNIGMTCLEEIDFADMNAKEAPHAKVRTAPAKCAPVKRSPAAKPAPRAAAPSPEQSVNQHQGDTPQPVKTSEASPDHPKMSEAQKRAIYNLSRRRGISVEDLEKMAVDAYGTELGSLTSKDASAFIRNLQQAA
jgi:hypothetical protein